MKNEFVTKVLSIMMAKISQTQCNELKEALYIALQDYELANRCTELLDLDRSYVHYLQLFIVRKKTEGKSERTLKQYQLHLERMLSGYLEVTDLSIVSVGVPAAFAELGLHTGFIIWKAKIENCRKNKDVNNLKELEEIEL